MRTYYSIAAGFIGYCGFCCSEGALENPAAQRLREWDISFFGLGL